MIEVPHLVFMRNFYLSTLSYIQLGIQLKSYLVFIWEFFFSYDFYFPYSFTCKHAFMCNKHESV